MARRSVNASMKRLMTPFPRNQAFLNKLMELQYPRRMASLSINSTVLTIANSEVNMTVITPPNTAESPNRKHQSKL